MKFSSIDKLQDAPVVCMLYLLVTFVYLGAAQDGTPYQPECDSLDEVISQIEQNIAEADGTVDCTKIDDCTGIHCEINLLGKTINCNVKLFPCDDPPQARLLVTGSGANFEQTVTQDSTYTIPGLTYSPFPFTRVNVQLIIQFEPQDDGILVGMDIQAIGLPLRYTLFEDVLIRTPPCTTDDPYNQDCAAMEELAESVPPPKSCGKNEDCNGIFCTETFDYTVDAITIPIKVDSELVVDSCSSPISLVVSAESKILNLDWTQAFNHSDSVPIDQDLSYNIEVVVDVTMQPQLDLEHILTSISYVITYDQEEKTDNVLTDALVPIPECRVQPDQPTEPTEAPTASDECESWQNIEDSLEFTLDGGYSVDECVTLSGCRGFNCTATYQDKDYQVVIEEFHCQDPVYLTLSIDGPGEHFTQNFTHNETVALPDTDDAQVLVHLVKESPTTLFLGVYMILAVPGAGSVQIPLIEDQFLEVTDCNAGAVTFAMETAGVSEGGGELETSSVSPVVDVTPKSPTSRSGMDANSMTTESSGDKASNRPVVEPVGGKDGIGMGWTVLLGIAAAAVVAAVVILFALYMRQRRRSPDLDILMEGTDENNRYSWAS